MKASIVISLLVIIVLAAVAHSAVPQKISYQGVLKDQLGYPVSDTNYSMLFKIYGVESGGTALWQETQVVATKGGVFNVILGSTQSLNLTFDNPYWLGVSVAGEPELQPRQMLTASPYTMYSARAAYAVVADSAVGAVAAVVPGAGLAGGGTEGEVILEIANGGVTHIKLGPGAVDATNLEEGAVGTRELADDAVTSAKIADGTIANADLSDGAITTGKIQNNAIDSNKLDADAVTTEKIDDGAVDTDELANTAVTSDKIEDSAIIFKHLDRNGATTGQVIKWNGTAWTAGDDATGPGGDITGITAGSGLTGGGTSGDVMLDVSFGGTGSATTVSRSDHNHDATYVNEGQAGSVNSSMITDGQVATNDIAADAVTTAKIATNAVQSSDIGPSAVTTAKIQDATILFADMAQNGAASGQIMKWNGTAWTASNDETGGGGAGGWVDDGIVVRLETSTDRVGIGTSSPGEMLEVAGNLIVTGKATIGPGHLTPTGTYAFVAGETNDAHGDHAVVSGGQNNFAIGSYGVVGGGQNNNSSGSYSVVSGGGGSPTSLWNRAEGAYSVVGGGSGNYAKGRRSVISGGGGNADSANTADGLHAVIGGGAGHQAGVRMGSMESPSLSAFATVGGGFRNTAARQGTTVAGGLSNYAGPSQLTLGTAEGRYASVMGGANNQATGAFSFVGGGGSDADPDGNIAAGDWSAITGGRRNRIGDASVIPPPAGELAFIGGGSENTVFGRYATIPGGFFNRALGDYSFAAGQQAKARHHGSIVLAANATNAVPDSVWTGADEQMVFRADGNIYITNRSEMAPVQPNRLINTVTGAYLSTGGQWVNNSDRDLKEGFSAIDGRTLLDKLDQLSVTEWSYKAEGPGVRHVGPVAQDFYRLFKVGSDDRSIASLDIAGVSLAAIQQLHRTAQVRERKIRDLESRVSELEAILQSLLAEPRGAPGTFTRR